MKSTDDSFVPLASLTAGAARKADGSHAPPVSGGDGGVHRHDRHGRLHTPAHRVHFPYVNPPEGVIPGRPSFYATAAVVNGYAQGIVVESHLGRPTKVEGNPQHPASMGATAVHGQSCVLDLYDPDRAKQVTENAESRDWDSFQVALARALPALRTAGGAGFRS